MITLRLASPEDAPAIAEVHVHGWDVYRGIVPDGYLDALDPARTDSLDRRARTTPFGRAIELRWVARRGAPCTEVNVTSTGRRTDPVQPDADVGMIAFRLPGRYVRLIYLMGRSSQARVVEGVARGPMEAMLGAMVAGFEPVP